MRAASRSGATAPCDDGLDSKAQRRTRAERIWKEAWTGGGYAAIADRAGGDAVTGYDAVTGAVGNWTSFFAADSRSAAATSALVPTLAQFSPCSAAP